MKEKVKAFFQKFKKQLIGVGTTATMLVTSCVTAFAAEPVSGGFSTSDIQTVLSPITEQFTFTKIASILAIVVGSAALLTLGWFGVRKVISVIQKALKRGKVSV